MAKPFVALLFLIASQTSSTSPMSTSAGRVLAGAPCASQGTPPPQNRWYVYRDACSEENHGEWTNWMPAESGEMIALNLVDTSEPFDGDTHVRIDIEFVPPDWAGIAVSSSPDYWGLQPSDEAFDLSAYDKLVFHARGARGGEKIRVRVAITGLEQFGDSTPMFASTDWIELQTAWTGHSLSLTGYDLTRVITPFVFITSRDENDSDEITFFLDEIYFTSGNTP